MNTFEKIKEILVTQFGIADYKIIPSSNLRMDLDLDSLDEVEAVMAIEEEFGLDIPTEDSDTFKTVGDVVDYVEENTERE